jgi:hypothetical protein
MLRIIPFIGTIIRLRNCVGLVGIVETTKERKRGGDSHAWSETVMDQDSNEYHQVQESSTYIP